MSTTEHFRARTPAAPEPFDPWFAERIAATAAAASDGTQTALVERRAHSAGVMPPLHVRGQDETFRVLAGELTFFVGDEVVRARAGDYVVAPSGTPRTYRVESNGARWLVLTRVVSVSRFEDFGRAHAEPLDDGGWPSPEELQSLTAIAAANGIRILGAPGRVPRTIC